MAYRKTDHYDPALTDELKVNFDAILKGVGEDITREGLLKTPERAAKAMQFLTQGYEQDATAILRSAMFKEDYSEMVLVKDIEVYSLCEHHMLPFFGRAHVAYIPNKKIIGISKIPRIVDVFARRLQVQERLTDQVANALQEILDPLGVGVIMKAKHMCMMMRGVQKQNSELLTSCMLGEFRDSSITRNEFLDLIRTGQ